MSKMKGQYLEKIYAGWLAKIIGIRVGAPVEGWTHKAIQNVYGELDGYPVNYKKLFAADDDSNGPIFLIRALEDEAGQFTAQSVGEALLNYAPYEHGFFWWGGYGVSTEHTAYLNLRHGILAPQSGSIEQNGSVVAEQIGGQIFIDSWGLVTPGNPDLAAKYAAYAASVTHGGNAVYGGIFIAACISYAFEETDIQKIIEKGLSYIPDDCEYARVVRSIMDFHEKHPENWRNCFNYVYDYFGYDRYGGACHIIPNAGLIILALLYGNGDFKRSLNICNMCGWDTDCNIGNLATILGVRGGLESINIPELRKPINDFYVCSSVMGSLNIMDVPYGALYMAKLAWKIAGEELPEPWNDISKKHIHSCHFEFAGSTHAMLARAENVSGEAEILLENSDEAAFTGKRSLKAVLKQTTPGTRMFLYKRTYLYPKEFHNSRYDPSFSPLLYPGQTVHGSIYIPEYGFECRVRLYAHGISSVHCESIPVKVKPGEWKTLEFQIPHMEGELLDEAGFIIDVCGDFRNPAPLVCMIDDFYFDGRADYIVDFSKVKKEVWSAKRIEVGQFTRLKGSLYLENNEMHLSCSDFGEAYTGRYDWENYTAKFYLRPLTGQQHMVNVRVQGAIRSYAAGFAAQNKFLLCKNENGYRVLAETDFEWEKGKNYQVAFEANGAELIVSVDGIELIRYTDTHKPYLKGAIGVSVKDGSHCSYSKISVS